MRDSLGDFLYIIIAVVGLIASALTKRKKKENSYTSTQNTGQRENEPVAQKPAKKTFSIEDFFNQPGFNDMFENKPYNPYDEEEMYVEQDEEEEDKHDEVVYDEDQKIEEGISTTMAKDELKVRDILEDKVEEFGVDFDLRKAIIYSEILNRKYT